MSRPQLTRTSVDHLPPSAAFSKHKTQTQYKTQNTPVCIKGLQNDISDRCCMCFTFSNCWLRVENEMFKQCFSIVLTIPIQHLYMYIVFPSQKLLELRSPPPIHTHGYMITSIELYPTSSNSTNLVACVQMLTKSHRLQL